jgi:NAD(P)-dependent dehydrogenase (short-subunit alcohol dehydrogenase family)
MVIPNSNLADKRHWDTRGAVIIAHQAHGSRRKVMKHALILGGTGDVGNGATRELLKAGYGVIAVSRGGPKAELLRERYSGERFQLVEGSVADERSAAALLAAIRERVSTVDAVVASLNVQPHRPETLLEWDAAELLKTIHNNLISHFVAAKTFIPVVTDGGVYIGIGGGMADKIFPFYGYNSMIQSALRMMFRYIDHEAKSRRIEIRELIISAMVTTEKKHNSGDPKFNWIADREVGQHIRAMIEDPASFPGPIQLLNSPKGVGRSLPLSLVPPPPPTGLVAAVAGS